MSTAVSIAAIGAAQIWAGVLIALVVFGVGVSVLYGLPLAMRWVQVRRWKRIKGKLALTYDDGPDEVTTPALLELLGELGVPATFYLVGFRGEKNREILESLKASPHELGTHTHWHKNAWKKSPWFSYSDAMHGYESLSVAVEPGDAFRPPFGKTTMITLIGMWLKGRMVHWWTVAANDTRDSFDEPEKVAKQMLDDGETVVLMHCHHNESHRRAYVLDLTRALVTQARARGIELVTMGGLEGDKR
jgi:peptidoglycan-N-acetylglucosamine deacetylase